MSSSASCASGTILVVDDEPAICSSLRRVFSRQYVVTVATSSVAALELLRGGERFDLVLCDLMMPEVSGVELFRAALRLAPEQAGRFVFMSGASVTAQMSAFLSSVPNPFVAKPFDMRRLTSLVRDVIAERSSP